MKRSEQVSRGIRTANTSPPKWRNGKRRSSTRDRLLDVGIRLLAQKGVNGVSLRTICSAAKVNTALMHYHFGSKTSFFDAVVERCLQPVNAERLRQLDEAEKQELGSQHLLSSLIRAWSAPLLLQESKTHQPALILRLYADIAAQTDPGIRKATESYSKEVITRFVAAFKRALPGLPADEAAWRFFYLVGILRNACADPYLIEKLTDGRWSMGNLQKFLDHLVDSLTSVLGSMTRSLRSRR